MNKKLVCGLVSITTLLSGAVFADCDPQFYMGAEAQATHLGFKHRRHVPSILKKTWMGGGAFVGSRFNEYLGAELGYTFVGKKSRSSRLGLVRGEAKIQNAYLDMMGYLPLDCVSDLVGSVGVGYAKSNGKITVLNVPIVKVHDKSVNVRVGVGAQYKFSDNVGARVMVNYQPTTLGKVKHMTAAKVGMFYQF